MTIQNKAKLVSQIGYNAYNDELWENYYNRQYVIDPADTSNLKSYIDKILVSNNTIDNTDIIYTSQLSEIPRFKLKEFIKEKGIKRTSRLGQSNCFILSKKIIQDLLKIKELVGEPMDMYFLNEELTDKVLDHFNNKNKNNSYYKKHIKTDDNVDELFFLNKNSFDQLQKTSKKWKYDVSDFKLKKYNFLYYRNTKNIDLINILSYIQNNPHIKIVFDENLITDLNKEGIQLDTDIESVLKDMIYSKDAANIKLGLEMIANLELNDYTLYKVSLFLNNFVNISTERQARTNRGMINVLAMNNRNLKTLLNTFKSKEIYWDRDWKLFVSGLIKNFTGTEHEVFVKEYLIDRLNNEFKTLAGGIKIEDLKFAK
jgi:hypothetical protein